MGKFIRLVSKNTKIKTCQLLNYKVAKEEHITPFLKFYPRNKQISKRMILTLMEYSNSRKRFNGRILTNLAVPWWPLISTTSRKHCVPFNISQAQLMQAVRIHKLWLVIRQWPLNRWVLQSSKKVFLDVRNIIINFEVKYYSSNWRDKDKKWQYNSTEARGKGSAVTYFGGWCHHKHSWKRGSIAR
jgi:hypothetical protein